MNGVFLLVKDPDNECRDMIFQRGGPLRMRVFCLEEEKFTPDPDELQFYADNGGEILAFETYNYEMDDPGLIIEAIRWYARYIENPEMEILPEDPRESYNSSSG